MTRTIRNLLVLVVLGLVAALPILWQRVQAEQANRSAEILFDYGALAEYARTSGYPLEMVLEWCKASGVTAIAVEEDSRDSLAMRGLARVVDYFGMHDLQAAGEVSQDLELDPLCTYYVARDAQAAAQIWQGAQYSLGPDKATLLGAEKRVVELRCNIRDLPALGVGIPYQIVSNLHQKYGFKVWLRPWNSPELSLDDLRELMGRYGQLASQGQVEGLIFGGLRNEVYGYPKNLEEMAKLLKATPLKLGVIELNPKVQQKGIVALAKLCPERVVRVMAVSPAHQAKLDPETLSSMYSLGVRERGIRLIYCRPYMDGVEKLTREEANQIFIGALQAQVAPHFQGQASTYASDSSPVHVGWSWWSLAIVLIAVSITSGFCMLIHILRLWPQRYIHLAVPLVAIIVALACVGGWGLKWVLLLLAWGAVTVFPIYALVILTPIWERAERYQNLGQVLAEGLLVLGVAVSLSLYAGLLAAALLSDTPYMLSLEVFRGVKLHSLIVPLLVFVIWLTQQQRKGGLDGIWHFLNFNLKVWHLVCGLFLVAIAGFYVMRTGNEGGSLLVSEEERALRRWLDLVLGVRPRFKEFLLGNPALFLLPALVALRWRALVPVALLSGAVGLTSLADTYAHIHTPLFISLHRTINGVVLGCALGVAAVIAAWYLKIWLAPYTAGLWSKESEPAVAGTSAVEGELVPGSKAEG